MQLVLRLTRDCNFACAYCYQAHRNGLGMSTAVAGDDTARNRWRILREAGSGQGENEEERRGLLHIGNGLVAM
jgi:sulfatase maturation enzyme AslB (radical SAM superfamily)